MLQKNWSELIKPSKMEVNVEESNGKVGVLTAEPLERGFGLTLGNAIRRILLSSLQGAAITSIKIKGVVHEFSTIQGVKEDLTDILLNLKTVAVKVHSPGLKKMYLKSSGSGELRAGNFETDSETEIMNPDQLIMTLDSNAEIEIEANVETGKGYVSAEVAEDENKIIGEIKLDATWSDGPIAEGFVGNESWDGIGNTILALEPEDILERVEDVPVYKERMLNELSPDMQKRRLKFLGLLSNWIATTESGRR